ncbi:hypothetical protein CBR_g55213 [Chara braunii]|uniref:Uncharacterized protein n=1 Tax=Chara braunii TaxID=69332 RepID=A0A388MCU9_CHABU|nr:hypothetical protein CBR_g55213 [Chara braunii]|eukprot:GBG92333.1 hypothetical protein CBR_g55213 [Chara braunii]
MSMGDVKEEEEEKKNKNEEEEEEEEEKEKEEEGGTKKKKKKMMTMMMIGGGGWRPGGEKQRREEEEEEDVDGWWKVEGEGVGEKKEKEKKEKEKKKKEPEKKMMMMKMGGGGWRTGADAVALILEYLQSWARQNPVMRKQLCAAWFPYTLLDRLKQQIADAVQSESSGEPSRRHWSSLQANLDKALQHHLTQTDIDSQDVKQHAYIELHRGESDKTLVVVV